MGNFSKTPSTVLSTNQTKGYVGMYIEQGVPVLDRDLNLMQDLVAAALRSLIDKCIGDGAIGAGFSILPATTPNNFLINAGTVFLSGLEITLPATINYTDQVGLPALTTPQAVRTDTVFLDVSISEVDGTIDSDLANSGDVGVQTSVRQKLNRVVRVAENSSVLPAPTAGHSFLALARLVRAAGTTVIISSMITDLRKTALTLGDLTQLARAAARPVFVAPGSEFTPTTGSGGVAVTLSGRNFNIGTLKVSFVIGGQSFLANISSKSDIGAVVNVPVAAAGSYLIVVETENGSDTTVNSFVVTKNKETKEKEKEDEKGIKEKDAEESLIASGAGGSSKMMFASYLDAEQNFGTSFIMPGERPDVGSRLLSMSKPEEQ